MCYPTVQSVPGRVGVGMPVPAEPRVPPGPSSASPPPAPPLPAPYLATPPPSQPAHNPI